MTETDALLARNGYLCQPLHRDHVTMFFDTSRPCGLAEWLNDKALIYQAEDLCQVWVLVSDENTNDVLGYFTLSAHSLETAAVSKDHRALSRQNRGIVGAHDNLPAHLLGKFALDGSLQGQGLGVLLMACVYDRYLQSAHSGGSKLLVLHTREPGLLAYYTKQYGFVAASGQPTGGLTAMYKTREGVQRDLDDALRK